jgi:hypothetical protein
MHRIRRITAIVVQLLMIQFLVVGEAAACPMAGDGAAGVTTPAAMGSAAHGMHPGDGAGTQTPRSRDGAQHSGPRHSHHHTGSHCALACAPTGCASGSQCASAAVGSSGASREMRLDMSGRRSRDRVDAPRSVSFAPEPPPPRA